jgi:hypothetical protein
VSAGIHKSPTRRALHLAAGLALSALLLLPARPARSEVVAEAALSSHYIFRGVDMLDGASPVFTPSVSWIVGETGLEISSWAYLPLTNRVNDWVADSDEIDLTVDYTRAFGGTVARLGLYHLSLPRLSGWPDEATTVNELYAELGRPQWPGRPVLSVSYELDEWEEHDTYIQIRGGHELLLTDALVYFGASVGFWSYGADSFPNFSGSPRAWTRRETLSDINFEVATTTVHGPWALTPAVVMTVSPDEVINPANLVVWGSLLITRAFPGVDGMR